jgi:hypothetical protein
MSLASICIFLAGCGEDDGLGQRFYASGEVTYLGRPVTQGTVTFVPENDTIGRAATGQLAEDGSFTLTTQNPGDGALAGRYHVIVISQDVDRSKIRTVGPGVPYFDRKHKAVARELLPRRYSSPTTSPLREEIKPQRNRFQFDLTD